MPITCYYTADFHLAARSKHFASGYIAIVKFICQSFIEFWVVLFYQLFLAAFSSGLIFLSSSDFCLDYRLACWHLFRARRVSCAYGLC